MDMVVSRSWQALALRGMAALLFGALAFFSPNVTLVAVGLVFGGYAFVDGALAMLAVARVRPRVHGWLMALEGLLGIGVGLMTLFAAETATTRAYLIATWAIATGILELTVASRRQWETRSKVLVGMAGLVSICVGVVMFEWPLAAAFVLVLLLGGYTVSFGAIMLVLAFRLRRIGRAGPLVQMGPSR